MSTKRSSIEHEALIQTLKELRIKNKKRQSDLAESMHRSQSFISKYESGEKILDILELREVCQALDISLRFFVEIFESKIEELKNSKPKGNSCETE